MVYTGEGDMGTNDRLRAAADILRERVNGTTNRGEWCAHVHTGSRRALDPRTGRSYTVRKQVAYMEGLVHDDGVYGAFYNPQDARFIEAVHPGVALALIEWMDAEADEEGAFPAAHPAVVMADAILEVADRG